jgi:hypothetical protein
VSAGGEVQGTLIDGEGDGLAVASVGGVGDAESDGIGSRHRRTAAKHPGRRIGKDADPETINAPVKWRQPASLGRGERYKAY